MKNPNYPDPLFEKLNSMRNSASKLTRDNTDSDKNQLKMNTSNLNISGDCLLENDEESKMGDSRRSGLWGGPSRKSSLRMRFEAFKNSIFQEKRESKAKNEPGGKSKKQAPALKKSESRKVKIYHLDQRWEHCLPEREEGAKTIEEAKTAQAIGDRRAESDAAQGRKKNHLIIFILIVRFLTYLKLSILSKKLRALKNYHYKILEENTYYPEFKKSVLEKIAKQLIVFEMLIKKKLKSLKPIWFLERQVIRFFVFVKKRIHLFQPDHYSYIYWNLLLITVIAFNIIHIPLSLSFELSQSDYLNFFWVFMDDLPNWIMIVNIGINLNSSYYSKGVFIRSRRKILVNYLKNNLILDILTLGPFFISKLWDSYTYKILYLFRMFYLIPKVRSLSEQLSIKQSLTYIFEAVKFSFSIFYMAHILCCAWHYLGIYQDINKGEQSWLIRYEVSHENWKVKYVFSMYWSLTTMVTVGYGDIVPQTTIEKVFTIFSMVLACGVFGYFLNYVGAIVQEAWKEEAELRTKSIEILRYLKSRNIAKPLQLKIKRYVEYMNKEKKEAEVSQNLFESLSRGLRNELFVEMYGRVLTSNKMLEYSFSSQFLHALTAKVREVKYVPDDVIYFQRETENTELYFIIRGAVDAGVLRRESGKPDIIVSEFGKNQSFGEFSFFTGKARELTARARQITTLAALSLEDFLSVANNFPQDKERYYELRDRINQEQEYSLLRNICASCGSKNHVVHLCPLLSYKPLREKVVKKHLELIALRSKNFRRRKSGKFNARAKRRALETAFEKIQEMIEKEGFLSEGSEVESDHDSKESEDKVEEIDFAAEQRRSPTQRRSNTEQLAAGLRTNDSEVRDRAKINEIAQASDKRATRPLASNFNERIPSVAQLEKGKSASTLLSPELRAKLMHTAGNLSRFAEDNSKLTSTQKVFESVKIYKYYMSHNNIDSVARTTGLRGKDTRDFDKKSTKIHRRRRSRVVTKV